jgi:hypothetical protein
MLKSLSWPAFQMLHIKMCQQRNTLFNCVIFNHLSKNRNFVNVWKTYTFHQQNKKAKNCLMWIIALNAILLKCQFRSMFVWSDISCFCCLNFLWDVRNPNMLLLPPHARKCYNFFILKEWLWLRLQCLIFLSLRMITIMPTVLKFVCL